MQQAFMQRALEVARDSLQTAGALPYGAIVVKGDTIIGEGVNQAIMKCDPTSHGEIEAIRDACQRLQTTDLSGCDLYTTAEPCAMCVATMYVTGISKLYYASALPQSAAFTERLAARDPRWRRRISSIDLRREVGLPIEQRQMAAEQIMAPEAQALFDEFARGIGA